MIVLTGSLLVSNSLKYLRLNSSHFFSSCPIPFIYIRYYPHGSQRNIENNYFWCILFATCETNILSGTNFFILTHPDFTSLITVAFPIPLEAPVTMIDFLILSSSLLIRSDIGLMICKWWSSAATHVCTFSDLILTLYGPKIGIRPRSAIGVQALPMASCNNRRFGVNSSLIQTKWRKTTCKNQHSAVRCYTHTNLNENQHKYSWTHLCIPFGNQRYFWCIRFEHTSFSLFYANVESLVR